MDLGAKVAVRPARLEALRLTIVDLAAITFTAELLMNEDDPAAAAPNVTPRRLLLW